MTQWVFCLLAALASLQLSPTTSLASAATTSNQNDNFLRKIPLNYLKTLFESTGCDSTYDDYGNCEGATSPDMWRKNSIDQLFEYNDGDGDVSASATSEAETTEEKRGRSQAGCDCQLRSEYVDLGPSTYPRYVKNVTCDEHRRCHQSRSKGYQCHPMHYKVSVIKLRSKQLDPHEYSSELHLPRELRCCWKASFEQTIVGCICGPQN